MLDIIAAVKNHAIEFDAAVTMVVPDTPRYELGPALMKLLEPLNFAGLMIDPTGTNDRSQLTLQWAGGRIVASTPRHGSRTLVTERDGALYPSAALAGGDHRAVACTVEEAADAIASWVATWGRAEQIAALEPGTVSREAFLAREGRVCPACGSIEVDMKTGGTMGLLITQRVLCPRCHATWSNCYELRGYAGLKRRESP